LLPGAYTIKVLAREWRRRGESGTYLSKFIVPNLNKEDKRIPISSVGVEQPSAWTCGTRLYTAGKDKDQITNSAGWQDGQKADFRA